MTQYEELEAVAQRFGVDMEQVRRDHLISFVLGAISADIPTDDIVFFGGTALSRTYCTDARLSEDIDLIAVARRTHLAAQIDDAVWRGLARSHGRPTWRPALSETAGSQPATLAAVGTTAIQIQLVAGQGYPWPTKVRDVDQRYSDAPPARLRTLTAPGFAAAKLSAWMDRHAPRDLFDLWAMSERGLIDAAAVETFVKVGPTGLPPSDWVFEEAPDESAWRRALSHQTRLRITAQEALQSARVAWAKASE